MAASTGTLSGTIFMVGGNGGWQKVCVRSMLRSGEPPAGSPQVDQHHNRADNDRAPNDVRYKGLVVVGHVQCNQQSYTRKTGVPRGWPE